MTYKFFNINLSFNNDEIDQIDRGSTNFTNICFDPRAGFHGQFVLDKNAMTRFDGSLKEAEEIFHYAIKKFKGKRRLTISLVGYDDNGKGIMLMSYEDGQITSNIEPVSLKKIRGYFLNQKNVEKVRIKRDGTVKAFGTYAYGRPFWAGYGSVCEALGWMLDEGEISQEQYRVSKAYYAKKY